ncbi:hypothetical protein O0L34_g10152 [Tuta absoluta]|nr:hypothetical protein O0L34_g10152 [Tuta absoluta]
MAKSTIESLEKVIKRFLSPIEEKIDQALSNIKRLEDKISILDKSDSTNRHCSKCNQNTALGQQRDCGPNGSQASKYLAKNPVAVTNGDKQKPVTPTGITKKDLHSANGSTRRGSLPSNVATNAQNNPSIQTNIEPSKNARSQKNGQNHSKDKNKKDETNTSPTTLPEERAGDDDSGNSDWQLVTKNRKPKSKLRKHQRVAITGTGPIDNTLQTTERVKKIHACFFKHDTSTETIKSYMAKKSENLECTVEKLKLKHQYYASFVITIPHSKYDLFMSASNWPPGTEVSEWFRQSTGRAWRAPHHQRQRHPSDRTLDESRAVAPTAATGHGSDAGQTSPPTTTGSA